MSYGPSKKHESKITAKGTELPLMDLKGKPYLQVAHRLVWFREEHPLGRIVTEVSYTDTSAVASATISVPTPDGISILSVGHKKETEENFGDFIEKAETGAIGRALAMAGYGTQFEPELDEGMRLADAPIAVAKKKEKADESPREERAVASGPAPEPRATTVAPKAEDAPLAPLAPAKQSGSAAIPESPPEKREDLEGMITQMSKVIVAKKKSTLADLKAMMTADYGSADKSQLSEENAKALYGKLRGMLA